MHDISTREQVGKYHRLFTVCGHTEVGKARPGNQDTFVIADLASGEVSHPCVRTDVSVSRPGMLALVCDGMGGRPAGDVAARVAADTIVDALGDAGVAAIVMEPADTLTSAVEDANRAILAEVSAHPEEQGMGTTCTAAVFGIDHVAVAQVGDSRAYLWRGGRLELLTRDQTIAEQMIDAGSLDPANVERFPFRHVLTQALGMKGVQPVITDVALEEGDRILLCSDGLHGPVSADAIASILGVAKDPAHAARELIAAALKAGGPDNVTVVVADCGRLEKPRAAADA